MVLLILRKKIEIKFWKIIFHTMCYYDETCIVGINIILELEKHQLTLSSLAKTKYCGGDTGRHKRYWKILFGDDPLPPKQDRCICGHNIVENCYIEYEGKILVVGNQCIKKFTPNPNRTCELCGDTHKARKNNRCKNCKNVKVQT